MKNRFSVNFSILLLLLLNNASILLHGQFLHNIAGLDLLNMVNANELVYLQSDCEVYSPGDTLWFKAYVRNKASLEASGLSQVFYTAISNRKGVFLNEEKNLITDGQSAGYLVIDKNIEDGVYYLVGYSSWMKNFDPDNVFLRKILVLDKIENGNRLVPYFNKEAYLPGDTVRVVVKAFDELNKPTDSKRFRYKFLAGEEIIARGGGSSSGISDFPFSFVLPHDKSGKITLRLWDDTRTMNFTVPLNDSIFVSFFPEGGNYLNRELNTVAFKAEYKKGIPVDIEGVILDAQGNTVIPLKTEHDGMGQFLLEPAQSGNFLKILKPAGYTGLYPLPLGQENSWAIQAKPGNNRIFVKINTNANHFDTCLFVLSVRGYACYYRLIPTASQASFSIPAYDLPPVIAVLTLLDKNNLPLAERLVFINRDKFITSELETDRKKYLCRDPVRLSINMNSRDIDLQEGQYSLSVYDAVFGSSGMIDEPNIISSIYLSPEIRGKIYNPDYYFLSDDRKTGYHLDLLLITQGWRKFSYLQSLTAVDSMDLPQDQDVIKGNIKRFKFAAQPYPTAGKILVYFAGNSEKIETDSEGNFLFTPVYTRDHTSPVMVSAKDNKGSEKVYLNLELDEFRKGISLYMHEKNELNQTESSDPVDIYEDLSRNMDMNRNNSIWIDEVEFTKKVDEDYPDLETAMIENFSNVRSPSADLLSASLEISDLLLNMGYNSYLDIETDCLKVFYSGVFYSAKFIVDGMNKGYLYSNINFLYAPSVIEKLYVMIGPEPALVYGSTVAIYIETDLDKYLARMSELKINNSIVIPGLQLVREFYSPQYDTDEEKKDPEPDLRKTIYWDPDVKLDSEGKTEILFYNSDRYGKVRCVLEGFTREGIPVYGEAFYNVATYRE